MHHSIPQLPNEPSGAYRALADYAALGAGARSLEKLCEQYRSSTDPAPPTRRLTTLKEWSKRWNWQERCAAYDAALAAAALAEAAQRWIERRAHLAESLWTEATALRTLGARALVPLLQSRAPPDWKPGELFAALRLAAALARDAIDTAAPAGGDDLPADLDNLSIAELEQLRNRLRGQP